MVGHRLRAAPGEKRVGVGRQHGGARQRHPAPVGSSLIKQQSGSVLGRSQHHSTPPPPPPPWIPRRGCVQICLCGVGGFCEEKKSGRPSIAARNSCLKTERGPPPGLSPFPHTPPVGGGGGGAAGRCADAKKSAGSELMSPKQSVT